MPGRDGNRVEFCDFNEWLGDGERRRDLTVSSEGASRAKAIAALDALAGKNLVNAETGIVARIGRVQRDKILSDKAREKSNANGFTSEQHLAIAARMEKAWEHARLADERSDTAGDPNIRSIKRFEAPIVLDGFPAAAYITAKESVEHGHRVYSLELQDIKEKFPVVNQGGILVAGRVSSPTPHGQPPADPDGNHLLPKVSPEFAERSSDLRKSADTKPGD